MADLVVNTENLRNLANQLATVHGTLTAAYGDARNLSGMIPHAGLASAVDEFTSGWDRRRKDLADRVDQLSGDGSWFDFALDAIGVLTFGVGSAALAGIKLGTVALRGGRAATLAVRSPGMVWGNGARQVIGNLLDRGLVGSIRQPMRMVAEESASVLSARPNLAQVVTHWGDDAIKGIRESDSIIISEFDQIASQARLGAGGAIDNLVTSGVDSLKNVVGTMGKIGSSLDAYNMVGIGINRSDQLMNWVQDQTGVQTPLGTLTTGLNEVYGFVPGLFDAPMGADWRSASTP